MRLTIRAINKDTWASVYLDLGDSPSAKIVRDAYFWAEYCYDAAQRRAERSEGGGMSAFEPKPVECGHHGMARDHAEAAQRRLEELEAIDPALKRRCPY